MSTTNLEQDELITCDLCKRRYNINVYKRHISENQCIKRNQRRLPFESIKQRSIRIGDNIFSIQQQQQQQQTNNDVQLSKSRENRKQQISNNKNNNNNNNNNNNKQYQEKIQRITPSNNRRRRLEQAKQLLERRIKYKPPWIQKQSNFTNNLQSKLNRTSTILLQTQDNSNKTRNQSLSSKKSTQKLYSHTRPSPPTTKFKNDDLPIKVSDRYIHNHIVSQQPILTHSPKIRISQVSTTFKYQPNRIDQTFSHEQSNSACQTMRKAYTWTRPSKQLSTRDIISPIQIPTFHESSSGPSHDQIPILINQNYNDDDDDDEFERYSPTPPSTPKYQQDKKESKHISPCIKQNFILHEQQTFIRPVTYQKAKRCEQQQQNEIQIYHRSTKSPRNQAHRKNVQSTFHLPPINRSSHPKIKHSPTINLVPWR
ncbi:unnamed protein product [Rotaria sordida]|uniref:Uncharacterized protein n=1 Tax=Rotaria sordida TaxID=392033 RepID=A0A813RZJ5_9BILA|nr:unnamed protein product [Rotaria sordida]CAF3535339.1 unnamed protein product [Rotaria sordida]